MATKLRADRILIGGVSWDVEVELRMLLPACRPFSAREACLFFAGDVDENEKISMAKVLYYQEVVT